jgi:hypothetical protein
LPGREPVVATVAQAFPVGIEAERLQSLQYLAIGVAANQVVGGEVCDTGGRSASVEIAARGIKRKAQVAELLSNQAGLPGPEHPDRDIGFAQQQVGLGIARDQFEIDFRLLPCQPFHHPGQQKTRHALRCGDAHGADDCLVAPRRHRGEPVRRLRQIGRMRIERNPGLGQRQAVAAPLEQGDAELGLERRDMTAQGGGAAAERLDGCGQRSVFGHLCKGLDQLQFRQALVSVHFKNGSLCSDIRDIVLNLILLTRIRCN